MTEIQLAILLGKIPNKQVLDSEDLRQLIAVSNANIITIDSVTGKISYTHHGKYIIPHLGDDSIRKAVDAMKFSYEIDIRNLYEGLCILYTKHHVKNTWLHYFNY